MAETIKKEGMEGCLSDWISPEQVQNAPPPYTLTCRPRNHTLIFSHFCEHR